MSGCAAPASKPLGWVAQAEVTAPPKPVPTIEILTSQDAADAYNADVEGWGDAMALQLGRLCREAQANGATLSGVTCPRPPDPKRTP